MTMVTRMNSKQINILILGSPNSGKTTLINQLLLVKEKDKEDIDLLSRDSLFNEIKKKVCYFDHEFVMNLMDTKGSEEYYFNRKDLYSETDIIILTFSYDCLSTYDDLFDYWMKEIEESTLNYGKRIPVLIVGTMRDKKKIKFHYKDLFIQKHNLKVQDTAYNCFLECSQYQPHSFDLILEKILDTFIAFYYLKDKSYFNNNINFIEDSKRQVANKEQPIKVKKKNSVTTFFKKLMK
ncbi:P-loop containing nucleoside triphosphate hydrolase protein [Neoconidiobolus thromboides FSU 785]|nr:P-loop containing nucleoside triphosphate hydrolase protein [Neoconidiobolus thromboides FSU 785]